jgi:hypothetical protein
MLPLLPRRFDKRVIYAFSALGFGTLFAIAQQDLPTPRSNTQFEFDRYLERLAPDFLSSEVSKALNYKGAVSLAAVPTTSVPASNIKELATGRVIGALFLSSGSNKFQLPPGFYSVFVLKTDNSWKVQFLDINKTVKGEAPASVTETTEEVAHPYVSIEHSVCHRFDKIIVCY